jgi:hypothetical protein
MPYYIHNDMQMAKMMVPATVINHTDDELTMLEKPWSAAGRPSGEAARGTEPAREPGFPGISVNRTSAARP